LSQAELFTDKIGLDRKDAIHQQRLLLKQQLSQVMRGNLPALKGHTTYLTKALRGLSQASSL